MATAASARVRLQTEEEPKMITCFIRYEIDPF
jgi:hypothetical protein